VSCGHHVGRGLAIWCKCAWKGMPTSSLARMIGVILQNDLGTAVATLAGARGKACGWHATAAADVQAVPWQFFLIDVFG
jgi:hypothetical protein